MELIIWFIELTLYAAASAIAGLALFIWIFPRQKHWTEVEVIPDIEAQEIDTKTFEAWLEKHPQFYGKPYSKVITAYELYLDRGEPTDATR